jgi:hypothetical protein
MHKQKNDPPVHPDFDGHLEKELKSMTPLEKLAYLSQQIALRHFLQTQVKRKCND